MPEDLGPAFFARETLAVSTASVGFTAATYTRNETIARAAHVTVETARIRWTTDGTAASATVGHIAEVGGTIRLNSPDQVSSFRAFAVDGVDSSLQCSFGR